GVPRPGLRGGDPARLAPPGGRDSRPLRGLRDAAGAPLGHLGPGELADLRADPGPWRPSPAPDRRRVPAGRRCADRPGRHRAAPPRRTRPGGPAAGRVAAGRGAPGPFAPSPSLESERVGVRVGPRLLPVRSLGALLALGFLLVAAPAAAVEVTFPLTI